ncbi:hypothetical protein BsWGS_13417 [Bradybaena similaris]
MSSPFKSPVVESTWERLHMMHAAREAVISSTKIVVIVAFLFIDMNYSVFSSFFSVAHPVVWFTELSLAILLLFQIISNGLLLCRYFWMCVFGSAIDITEDQSKLMALPLNSTAFKTKSAETSQSPSSSLNLSHSNAYGNMESTPLKTSPNLTTHSSSRYQSPANNSSSIMSPYASYFSTPSQNSSHTSSFNNSSLNKSLNASAVSQSSTRCDYDRANMRSWRSKSVPLSVSSSKYKHITDVDSLHRYINEEEEKERIKSQVSLENLPAGGNLSYLSYGLNPLDFTQIFRKFTYQLSHRSLAAPALNSSSDQISNQGIGDVWNKYSVSESDLSVWIEKLRKWLSFTIVSRLNTEIDEVNAALRKIGCDDTQVGEVGVSTLKQLALTKGTYVPTLNSVVSYMDFSGNQEYLRNRIKDLNTGSMSAFTWDKGGNYGKPWSEHLPTDAALVMHLFCCYLDSRLPAHPKYPDGKSFTSQHFVKTPDKPNTERKDNLQIYNSSINPPHYQVVIGSQVYHLSKGRNNMFQAILLFLYHIKVKECGMLGRVNLGMSGLNMLWIFD